MEIHARTHHSSAPPPPPRWVTEVQAPPASKAVSRLAANTPDPPGFAGALATTQAIGKKGTGKEVAARKALSADEMDSLKLKKAWEVAIAPAKALPMSAIGMYMSGNSLQIFSIFMLWQMFKTPIMGLLNINSSFQRFESDKTKQQLLLAKLAFVACNLLGVALGVYKINAMGLLPTTTSDWLAWERARVPLETAVPGYG